MARKPQATPEAASDLGDDALDEQVIVIPENEVEDEGVESLKQQLDAANKAREDAERRATEREADLRRATENNARNTAELEDSRLQTIQNAIAAKEANRKDLRARLIAAKTNADYEAEADINLEVAQLATELHQLNAGKNQLENRIANEREAAKTRPVNTDPIEQAVSGMTPRAAAWVRSHREAILDPIKNADLIMADRIAQRDGIDPNSDAYFEHMDAHMGYGERQADEETVPRREPLNYAAPVSRNGGSDNGLPPGKIRLNSAQRELADEWGWTYKKYWDNMTPEERSRQN